LCRDFPNVDIYILSHLLKLLIFSGYIRALNFVALIGIDEPVPCEACIPWTIASGKH